MFKKQSIATTLLILSIIMFITAIINVIFIHSETIRGIIFPMSLLMVILILINMNRHEEVTKKQMYIALYQSGIISQEEAREAIENDTLVINGE